jgi:short-subunit dehydrogenase
VGRIGAVRVAPFESALVTGASSGIGAAIADELGNAGVPTVVVARRGDRLDELAARHAGFEVLVADLSTDAGQRVVAERIADAGRPIDLVVNCAGFGTTGTFHELDPARLAREIEVNVGALTKLSHAALASMVPRRRGWLLNVSSIAGFQAAPRLAVYAATKAYVTTLSEGLHEEVRGTGVHVTALCPGLTRTEFQQVSSPDGALERYPSALWMSAEDVARTGLDDVIAGKALSVPGIAYKTLLTARGLAPRGLVRRLSGMVQRGGRDPAQE